MENTQQAIKKAIAPVLLKLEIHVEEMTTKPTNGEKPRAFNTYKTVAKNGDLRNLKFRKACAPTPEENCFIYVYSNNISEQTNNKYKYIWIHKIEKVELFKEMDFGSSEEMTTMFSAVDPETGEVKEDAPFDKKAE